MITGWEQSTEWGSETWSSPPPRFFWVIVSHGPEWIKHIPCFYHPSTSETLFSTHNSPVTSRDPCQKMKWSKLRDMEWLSFPRSQLAAETGPRLFPSFSRKETCFLWRHVAWDTKMKDAWILIQCFLFFFHFTLMMLFRALIPRTLLRSQHSSTVGRPWVGATKDIVFSLRQTWVQMPTLPLISLWDWASSVISLVFSFLVFKIELATCVSKFARLKWA